MLMGMDLLVVKVMKTLRSVCNYSRHPRNEGFDRSLYKLTNGSVILGEPGLEPGDLPFDNDPFEC
ncbi:MAG: hypothetical protein CM15mP77_4120 [Synechococcus sp.]|nr:MAG: hypothetical protein CM15mP77_4120 [Synechococcus sp.]